MLVVAHQDRLARFGFALLQHLCRKHGCELLVLNTEQVSPEQEMVQDLMAITHCFSSRLDGLGNYRRALKEALKVILAHRIALDPTEKQKEYFRQACGTARLVWNWALAEWNYRYDLGANTDAREIKRYFDSFKYEAFPWLKNIHRDAHAQPFAASGKAWKAYFNGEVEGRPQFKKKGKRRDGFYVACDKFSSSGKTVRLPVIGQVKLREPLRFTGKMQSATVSREADGWFIAIAVEIPQREVHPPSGEALGIDLGLTTFAVLSNGQKVEARKPLGKGLQRLRRLSRAHSRKRPGSHNRQKAALRLARCHRRMAHRRRDFLPQFTTRISKNHAEIFVENLHVKGMVQNRHWSRAIHDVGWSELRRQLEYKSLLNGSVLTMRDPFYASSKTCSECGYVREVLPLSVREWTCPACQTTHDRDVNAAINLKQNTVGHTGINAWGQEGSGLAGTASETGLVEPGTLQWVNTHFHSQER